MSQPERQLHLNAFVLDLGHHEGAWRLPEADPFAIADISYYVEFARAAEAAAFDSVFLSDVPMLEGDPRYRPVGHLEPLTLLGALAMATERIGLIATASTSYTEPYGLARQLASLDHISGGRIGWNIVTTADDEAARNFGRDGRALHRERYERAAEYLEVVTKLWDSWEDDVVSGDKAGGRYADAERIHAIDHRGRFFRVDGPLNVPRSPQAYPLLVQAGSSENGRAFASRYAEAIFTAQRTLADAQAFATDVRARASAAGRDPDGLRILPGIVPVIGSTEAEARERVKRLEDLVIPEFGLQRISSYFGVDLTALDLDAPLPELPAEDQIEGFKSRATLVATLAGRERLTVRQLLRRLGGGRGHWTVPGTPEQIADTMETWFRAGAADGFNVMPAVLPHDLWLFTEHVVPLLRAKGIFRHEYDGSTLRDHYGLARPANRLLTTA